MKSLFKSHLPFAALMLVSCGGKLSHKENNQEKPDDVECVDSDDCGDGDELCIFGRCVLDPKVCEPSKVTCADDPPECGAKTLPSIVDGCWGECVPYEECGFLGSCEPCLEAELGCQQTGEIKSAGCFESASDCDSCDCLPPEVCGDMNCYSVHDSIAECIYGTVPPETDEDDSDASSNETSDATTSDEPVPGPTLENPDPGSYLDGRGGAACGKCIYHECDREVALCLSEEECSLRFECLVFCGGSQGDALNKCQLDCFHGDEQLRDESLAALDCSTINCCDDCSTPCQ